LFYLQKKNKSDSISVQILTKDKRKNKLLKTIGYSKDLEVIASLVLAAKDYISKRLGQQTLFQKSQSNCFDSVFSSI